MPFQSLPRLLSVLASVLAAGVMLTVAGCSHVTPLGPDPAATMPQPHQLRSPLVLEDMRMQHSTPGGGCPAGSAAISGQCRPVLPHDRHAGHDHLRRGLPDHLIPAADAPGTAAGRTHPIRILDHRPRCRRAGGDGSYPGC